MTYHISNEWKFNSVATQQETPQIIIKVPIQNYIPEKKGSTYMTKLELCCFTLKIIFDIPNLGWRTEIDYFIIASVLF